MQVKIHIKWKDSSAEHKVERRHYRNHSITRYGDGWIIETMNDNNIYKNRDSALNAIDHVLSGHSRQGPAPTRTPGIDIIGKK